MERPDETRKILKIFGVAVTDFEEESERLLSRIAEAGANSAAAVPALRDALELMREVNQKWIATTEHLFRIQGRFLDRALESLPEPKRP
jgi:hypothetical protein